MLGKNTVSMLAEDLAKKFRGEEVAPPTEVKKLVSSAHFPNGLFRNFFHQEFVVAISKDYFCEFAFIEEGKFR